MESALDSSLERRLIGVQHRIASRVVLDDRFSSDSSSGSSGDSLAVVGVDQSFAGDLVISGAVELGPEGDVRAKGSHFMKAAIPYVPGLLSFREGPPAIKAVRCLDIKPTLLFVDGCGVNHPRGAGLASYVGVILDLPTIGISKSILCGSFDLPDEVGEASPLFYGGNTVGYILKSKKGCKPIVVAPGHRISAQSALEITRLWIKGHKLPEPCRLAHEYANEIKRDLARTQSPAASSSPQARIQIRQGRS